MFRSPTPLVTLTLMSGAEWPVTLSDMLLALGIVLLLFEVIKGARPGAKYLTDHLLSLIVFGAAVAEFVLWPRFGTSTYFLLAMLSLADFLTGVDAAAAARRGACGPARRRRREQRPRRPPNPGSLRRPRPPVAAPLIVAGIRARACNPAAPRRTCRLRIAAGRRLDAAAGRAVALGS